ncbi:lipopolysaccharide biosynthesis protein [Anaerosacchariphilus polymeriproducens]|nr:oligosaccharide flippase family protein [Anaerosacchariphilus polymeriproducens]
MEKRSNLQNLINGTVLYFVATFISKSMSLLMLRFITREIATESYGYYDVIVSLVPLFLPIFTVQSIEAIFRFLFDADENQKKQLLSNLWVIVFMGNLAALVLLVVIDAFFVPIRYMCGFYFYYVVSVFLNMYQRVARSYGKSKKFAISGIINSLFLVVFQIISLYVFCADVNGLLYSYVLAGLFACLYLEMHTKSLQQFKLRYINKYHIKKLIGFGLPLVPNNISWWASSSINRMLIITFISENASGLFGVANKFSSILAMLTGVFQLAWQESAIISYNSKEKSKYYSKVYSKYFFLLFGGCCFVLPIIKICFPLLVSESYQSVWILIPLLMFGTSASSMSMFYGAGYIASQKTKDAFWTTIVGAVINIVICLTFIKPFGLFAPALSSLIAYIIVWVIRHITMKNYFQIKIEWKWLVIVILMGIISTTTYYFAGNIMNWLVFFIIFIFMALGNHDVISKCIKKKNKKNRTIK